MKQGARPARRPDLSRVATGASSYPVPAVAYIPASPGCQARPGLTALLPLNERTNNRRERPAPKPAIAFSQIPSDRSVRVRAYLSRIRKRLKQWDQYD
jgi:hypothetical protein